METALTYLDDRVMWVSTDEAKWKRRIEEWAQAYPDLCQIMTRPENNDGCMVAKMPASWLRMRPPIKRNMTEEQIKSASERMRKAREAKDEQEDEDDS